MFHFIHSIINFISGRRIHIVRVTFNQEAEVLSIQLENNTMLDWAATIKVERGEALLATEPRYINKNKNIVLQVDKIYNNPDLHTDGSIKISFTYPAHHHIFFAIPKDLSTNFSF